MPHSQIVSATATGPSLPSPLPKVSYSSIVSGTWMQNSTVVNNDSGASTPSSSSPTLTADSCLSSSPASSSYTLPTILEEPEPSPTASPIKGPPLHDATVGAFSVDSLTPLLHNLDLDSHTPTPLYVAQPFTSKTVAVAEPMHGLPYNYNPHMSNYAPLAPQLSHYPYDPIQNTYPATSYTNVASTSYAVQAPPAMKPYHGAPVAQPPPAMPYYRPWTEAFFDGVRAANDRQRVFHAQRVVGVRDWNRTRIQDLAWMLIWEATGSADAKNFAKFAEALRECLRENVAAELTDVFAWHVRDYAMETFRGWWEPNGPYSLVGQRPASRTHVESALALSRFIGQLFVGELLTQDHIFACMDILLVHLCSLEHIIAFHEIIMHANMRLCETPRDRAIVLSRSQTLTQKAPMIPANASLQGVQFRQSQVATWMAETWERIETWIPRLP
ncbi:hypothetical protein EVG20_g2491 [Dentipellis fragilis]|uniref:Uncharacterized protein n=1 Tax=Dentipellis fragilis TaxID=205917 RepID=A0A4Y9Z912_9AGAM|nr:hypothetical protein EVG20_g2491 [Dentipellis fragilis]